MQIAALVLVVIVIALLIRPKPVFVMTVKAGRAKVTKGSMSPRLRQQFAEALADTDSGSVRGERASGAIELVFKGAIDEGTRQRLRNLLGVYQS